MSVYQRGRPHKFNAITGDGSRPPKVVGEYRIKTKKNITIYIGITNDLYRRMNEHIRSGKINDEAPYFEWMAAKKNIPYHSVRVHEVRKIRRHNPELNKNEGGGGREPKIIRYGGLRTIGGMDPLSDDYIEVDDGNGKIIYAINGTKKKFALFLFTFYRVIGLLLKVLLLATILYFMFACFIKKLSFYEALVKILSALCFRR